MDSEEAYNKFVSYTFIQKLIIEERENSRRIRPINSLWVSTVIHVIYQMQQIRLLIIRNTLTTQTILSGKENK